MKERERERKSTDKVCERDRERKRTDKVCVSYVRVKERDINVSNFAEER